MSKICMCCGRPLDNINQEWHPSCIKRMFASTSFPNFDLNEDTIIEENINGGNLVSGVQKKFSLTLSAKRARKTFSILNHEYIIKTPQESLKNIVLFEWIGMKLASICGIETVECGIIKSNGIPLFITKRIDRINNKKIPMEDFCQLSNTQTEYKYSGSYEKCYEKVIKRYSDFPTIDKIKFYKLILFSYIIGNTDMHLKNFSLYEIDDKYQLTPAYDLVPVLMVFPQEDMALTLHGKTRNLTKNDIIAFGTYMGINKNLLLKINNEISSKKDEMVEFIYSTSLEEKEKKRFAEFISKRINLI